MNELGQWITTDKGARLTGYSVPYIRHLARAGQVEARKVGRDWLVHREGLLAHKAEMDALGMQKHNPKRARDVREGRA